MSPYPGPEAAMSVHVDEAELRSAGIQYLGLQLDDVEQQKIGPTFQQSGDWVNQALGADNSKVWCRYFHLNLDNLYIRQFAGSN